MRYFNTSGPCYPAEHYTVMREVLVAKGQLLVERGRYFTIFAPRQAGQTTYFHLLLERLKAEGRYLLLWISFESFKTLSRERFYQALGYRLRDELSQYGLDFEDEIIDQFGLEQFIGQIHTQAKPLVLVIDEFEDIPAEVLSELMHTFRAMYQRKHKRSLQALLLVGVSTVAELIVSSASPFNIAEELRLSYFTLAEVQTLIQQYVTESGQPFEEAVIQAIYDNTQGQPGLVCALCQHLVEGVATDRSQAVTMGHFYPTLKHFLIERFDKNIINIIQKARVKRDFMIKVLFGEKPVPFTVDDPDIAFLFAHGVIDNSQGYVEMPVPLYSKRLINAFRPLINGEIGHYFTAHETFSPYLTPTGLNLNAILDKYREYVRRRGFRAFDTQQLKEAAWHYSLDGFINFFIERIGGQTFVEVPTGRGRTDILLLYQGQKYIIETKIFTDHYSFEKGKKQLADYLTSEGLVEGYYVVFSPKHSETDTLYFAEMIEEKQIYTYLIRTNFEQPSQR